MAGDLLLKYANVAAITITLASLADNGVAVSSEIDNSSNLYLDALVQLKIKTTSTVDSTGYIAVYAVGSVDGGTSYPDSVNRKSKPIAIINANVNNTTFTSNPVSVAQAFFAGLPEKWKIVIENKTGASLDSTEGNHAKQYQGIKHQFT